MKEYSQKEEFFEQVKPLMDALHAKCVELDMPFVAIVQYEIDKTGFLRAIRSRLEGKKLIDTDLLAFMLLLMEKEPLKILTFGALQFVMKEQDRIYEEGHAKEEGEG